MLPYAPQYPHQAYGYELALTRLQRNVDARTWLAAADSALLQPHDVVLPYAKQRERIAGSAALGYAFTVPVGRRVAVTVASEVAPAELFVDLFRVALLERQRLTGALPGSRSEPFVVDVVEGGDYVLRIQPPLGTTADVDVAIETSALLAFPV